MFGIILVLLLTDLDKSNNRNFVLQSRKGSREKVYILILPVCILLAILHANTVPCHTFLISDVSHMLKKDYFCYVSNR